MPCTSEGYPEPSAQQYDRQLAAALFAFAAPYFDVPVSADMERRGCDVFQQDDTAVQELCALMTRFNPRDPFRHPAYDRMKSQDLLSYYELNLWWVKHQAADAARREIEAKLKAAIQLRQEALAKLTPAEREALGIKEG